MAASWERINGVVYGVIVLHLFIYFATVSCVIVPWLSFSVPGVTHLGVLTALVAASLACLIIAVVSDPGSVPDDYTPDAEAHRQVVEVKKKSGGARVCQKCGRGKPPRAHHCRMCRRCITRMDHHCPWLNNCVGHGNYRAFLQFLVYATAATCHALALLAAHAVYALSAATSNRAVRTGIQSRAVGLGVDAPGAAPASYSISWAALQVCATAAALPVALALCGLTVWNAWLVSQNKTTIEYHEGVTAQIRAARAGTAVARHPYHLGPVSNVAAVMGPMGPAWCLPLVRGRFIPLQIARNRIPSNVTKLEVHPYDLGPLSNVAAVMGPLGPGMVSPPASADGTGTAFPTIWDGDPLAPS